MKSVCCSIPVVVPEEDFVRGGKGPRFVLLAD